MPTPSKGPRMGGSPAHERLMLSNLAAQLFENTAITTTERRAKRLRPYAEKLITLAKRGDTHARRQVLKDITDRSAVANLFEELAPKFAQRAGGYTRITRVGNRKGDNAPMAVISLVLEPVSPKQAVVKEATQATEAAAKPVEEDPMEGIQFEEGPVEENPAEEEPVEENQADTEVANAIEPPVEDPFSEEETSEEK